MHTGALATAAAPRRRAVLATLALLVGVLAAPVAHAAPPTDGDARYGADVAGGADAPAGAWEAIAALVDLRAGSRYQGQFCGGVLIDPSWVLTAAHCANALAAAGTSAEVVVGAYDLASTDGEAHAVRSIVTYPGHATVGDPDLALIQLDRASTKRPLPVMDAADEPAYVDGESVGAVAGWGRRTPGANDFPTRLQSALVPVWSDGSCATVMGSTFVAARHLCAGDLDVSACDGDSGGPLLAVDRRGTAVVAGIVSFGPSICTLLPGVFNQVSWYGGWIRQVLGASAAPPTTPTTPAPASSGYWFMAGDGGVFSFGAPFHGSPAGHTDGPAVGIAARAGGGYWIVTTHGRVTNHGAPHHGDLAGRRLNAPIIGIEATPSGGGYWLLGRDGGIFSFGDATFHGSTGSLRLNHPVMTMAAAPGGGYWFVAGDGGVFSFGAPFHGSPAGHIEGVAIGMVARAGGGYWIVSTTGRVYGQGAPHLGDLGGRRLNAPIIGIEATPSGGGYWLLGRDGGIISFGDAAFHGSTGSLRLNEPIVAIAAAR